MADMTVHQLQARAEGIDIVNAPTVTMLDAEFRVADRVGLMPLMRFALAARNGADSADMEALAAMYELMRDCIHPDDWARFEQHAMATKADADDLLKVVGEAIQVVSARPTQRPAVSSDGSQPTSQSSNAPRPSSPSSQPSPTPAPVPPRPAPRPVDPQVAEMVPVTDLLNHRSLV